MCSGSRESDRCSDKRGILGHRAGEATDSGHHCMQAVSAQRSRRHTRRYAGTEPNRTPLELDDAGPIAATRDHHRLERCPRPVAHLRAPRRASHASELKERTLCHHQLGLACPRHIKRMRWRQPAGACSLGILQFRHHARPRQPPSCSLYDLASSEGPTQGGSLMRCVNAGRRMCAARQSRHKTSMERGVAGSAAELAPPSVAPLCRP